MSPDPTRCRWTAVDDGTAECACGYRMPTRHATRIARATHGRAVHPPVAADLIDPATFADASDAFDLLYTLTVSDADPLPMRLPGPNRAARRSKQTRAA